MMKAKQHTKAYITRNWEEKPIGLITVFDAILTSRQTGSK